ncbi:glycosyltransferase [Cupriavidus gilardii]|uniref:glycosyltransferase n=1 Tax=Cupriavidus gilardii TaxID=82541 RepID=UPI001571FFDB|nr:glycosyltransferase [Cupriavidus gilardii]NSX04481.1 glycosyltransferase [Cupriavidus gilardii]
MPCFPTLSLSVVSHGHDALLAALMRDLGSASRVFPDIEVIVTENIPGNASALAETAGFPCRVICNPSPKGFGANHNAAFQLTRAQYFGVLNPDLRIPDVTVFAQLIEVLRLRPGVAGPRVMGPEGAIEDSARRVPTPRRIFERAVLGRRRPDYAWASEVSMVDWLAGMCLMFDRETYEMLGGFDERYFLYCEDVDICLRAHLAGRSVSWVQAAFVVHDARRKTLRNKQHFAWHVASLGRLMTSSAYRRYMQRSP